MPTMKLLLALALLTVPAAVAAREVCRMAEARQQAAISLLDVTPAAEHRAVVYWIQSL